MSNYSFRPSNAEHIGKQVFVALAGTTGSGKTESAMRIAGGIVGAKGKFCVIDTEHRRALNKRGRYQFDHLDLQAPYSPDNFKGAIDAAEKAGYGAIVVDNFSHEWFGEGGCSDMQEEALERMSKGDSAKAERLTALAWKAPKQAHKKLMYRILQCSVPLIFALRAEPKIKFQKDSNGKTQIVDAGWQPICEKMFGYEMLVYALLMPENPGVPVHLKKLEQELEPMFPLGKQITEESGKLLAAWAAGGSRPKEPAAPQETMPDTERSIAAGMGNQSASKLDKAGNERPSGGLSLNSPATAAAPDGLITREQIQEIETLLDMKGIDKKRFLMIAKVKSVDEIRAERFDGAVAWIDKQGSK